MMVIRTKVMLWVMRKEERMVNSKGTNTITTPILIRVVHHLWLKSLLVKHYFKGGALWGRARANTDNTPSTLSTPLYQLNH